MSENPTDANELVKAAREFGGEVKDSGGTIYGLRMAANAPGHYWVIGLPFFGRRDMVRVSRQMEELQLVPLSAQLLKGLMPEPEREIDFIPRVKKCPIHGKVLEKSRKPGQLYCKSKNADGSYCTHTEAE